MLETYLVLFLAALGWLAVLTCVVFAVDKISAFWTKPPAIDVVIILFTMGPWVVGAIAGARINGHWTGAVFGLLTSFAAQFVAVELFDLIHRGIASRRNNNILGINRSIERRTAWWRNRMGLWATVPSVPFFMMNRVGHVTTYYPLILLLGFTKFKQSEYIVVSRQKIKNLVGADLVWCLYCDWMTGGWTLTSEMLNEVESYWCPLLFEDKGKCEKCAQFFRMEHWAAPGADPQEVAELAGRTGGGRCASAESLCVASSSNRKS